MKNAVLFFVFISAVKIFAQNNVGIGTVTPHASSELDIVSTNKGLLIPRVADTALIASPATGLLIYLSPDAAFWYFDGIYWVRIGSGGGGGGGGNAWTLSGNAGTVASTNFLGTTDNINLTIRTNNVERLRVKNQTLEFLNSGNSVFIGEEAGQNDDLSNRLNVFVGYQSGKANTTGSGNVAVGYKSLFNSTAGNENVALGRQALSSNSIGSYNIAIGRNALLNNTFGINNIAIGTDAGSALTTGTNNTFLGNEAGKNTGAVSFGNVFLGYRAGINETGNNKLYIENSNTATPLIYGEFDNNIVRANGELQVSDPSTTGYRFPTTDGSTGQVLTTDGNGTVSWGAGGSGGGDADWYEVGTTLPPNAITDNIYKTGGNVGIGTTNPIVKLQVDGTGKFVGVGTVNETVLGLGGADAAAGGYTYTEFMQTSQLLGDLIIRSFHSGTMLSNPKIHFSAYNNTPILGARITMDLFNGRLGIGNIAPSEKLHVEGNFRLEGAFMPDNTAGTSGQMLLSAGANAEPTWGPKILTASAIGSIGRYSVTIPTLSANTQLVLTVTDADCTTLSNIMVAIRGNTGWTAAQRGNITIRNIEVQNGQWIVLIDNQNVASFNNVTLNFTGIY